MMGFKLFCGFLTIVAMMAIWNHWIWIGRDGYNLPDRLRPGFFRFWFVITPSFLLGMKTGMEGVTLSKDPRKNINITDILPLNWDSQTELKTIEKHLAELGD